jgi:hypothetical protein
MTEYCAGLLAVVEDAPGVEYHIRADGLEEVLQYLDEHAEDSGKSARAFVQYATDYLGEIAAPYFVLRGRKRICMELAGRTKITLELHAYMCEPDLNSPDDTDDVLGLTFHPLKSN